MPILLMNIARIGKFSSDRTILEYCQKYGMSNL
ncbi:glycogen/starch/alpha-glucan phosphorylase [Trichormus variabilis ARAD]|uniref:Glycogen/starch/alpha-glucan phosphorylase n=1 Tax=Trichormus variabilis N2B TaxID=2681315 RepID=A0ABR6S761_ANAVA|nr:glycogen/starch/alpha-glucan phosphorylase [Trichormus variabilis ARAD]MBC1256961.1 glycogen/starch/alpha-glucan phosphorylase [Trichormus variabilis V5]MBC1266014.1 glycogen/starch/alpha-glucan phosphorylase [Trichormus variabilis FSR]MBC1302036.1 glycogen/starch/alpha-glucan phosphorylase [Trichormus variabilis N2B]MBC1310872.1 glycogen/starch/alpha-glucan phosphorylase [Trichormus variabilis PNB]MBC1326331.1 glycogen/starch/alpha-glucan phosphorylase [Trichormus variabilis 9RC]MBD238289